MSLARACLYRSLMSLYLIAVLLVALIGCGGQQEQQAEKPKPETDKVAVVADASGSMKKTEKVGPAPEPHPIEAMQDTNLSPGQPADPRKFAEQWGALPAQAKAPVLMQLQKSIQNQTVAKSPPRILIGGEGKVGGHKEGGKKQEPALAKLEDAKRPDADGEEHNTASYARILDNPFQLAQREPLSTFSIDVDTASYSNIRRFLLQDKKLPPKDAVRIEELLNFFDYDYPQPKDGHPLAINTEVAACPWDSRLKLVRIGLKARYIPVEQAPPRNFVFLLDTSGSMNAENRLPLLKQSLHLLIERLRPQDRVAIVAYAGSAGLVLPSTSGTEKKAIASALDQLHAGGSTNGGQGIQLAQQNFLKEGVNRVILGTDGDFNVGLTSEGDLVRLIEEKRKSEIYLSVLGFGMDNLKDSTMEKLAHHGNGSYAYIDSLEEAQRIFVDQGAALFTLANDVKLQVEFNPARVQAWRLIGYENRLLKHEDFNDDKKDAGDLGSGLTVTAFYAIVAPGTKFDLPKVDGLRYQKPAQLSDVADSNELLTVRLRYKDPGAEKSKLLEQPVQDKNRKFAEATVDFRFAAAVAAFGQLLRGSEYAGEATFDQVREWAAAAQGDNRHGRRGEFVHLVRTAGELSQPKAEKK